MSEGIITRRIKTPKPLLLDSFPNSAAAYSLRSLTLSGQDNPVVKVRRDSDNAEQDFSSAEINDGSLLTFVGNTASDNGFVTTWYDQSGNGNDATQSTAGSQPKIVDAGVLVTENGKPALDFDGSDDYFQNTSIVVNQPSTYFVLYRYDDISDITNTDLVDGINSRNLIDLGGVNHRLFAGVSINTTIAGTLNQELSYNLFNGASSEKAINGGTTETVNPGTDALDGLRVAANAASSRLDGTIQEIIIYDSDQSSNRTGIESNINNHYGIY